MQLPAELHRYFPQTPAIPLKEVVILDAGKQLSPPWNGLGQVYFSLAFWLVGHQDSAGSTARILAVYAIAAATFALAISPSLPSRWRRSVRAREGLAYLSR